MMNPKQPLYIIPGTTQPTHSDDLYQLLDVLDELHTQASEGNAQQASQMSTRELVTLLQDIIYTAQETVNELSASQSHQQTQRTPYLRIVEKREKIS